MLSCHVQKIVAIWWPATELQQGEVSNLNCGQKSIVKWAPDRNPDRCGLKKDWYQTMTNNTKINHLHNSWDLLYMLSFYELISLNYLKFICAMTLCHYGLQQYHTVDNVAVICRLVEVMASLITHIYRISSTTIPLIIRLSACRRLDYTDAIIHQFGSDLV